MTLNRNQSGSMLMPLLVLILVLVALGFAVFQLISAGDEKSLADSAQVAPQNDIVDPGVAAVEGSTPAINTRQFDLTAKNHGFDALSGGHQGSSIGLDVPDNFDVVEKSDSSEASVEITSPGGAGLELLISQNGVGGDCGGYNVDYDLVRKIKTQSSNVVMVHFSEESRETDIYEQITFVFNNRSPSTEFEEFVFSSDEGTKSDTMSCYEGHSYSISPSDVWFTVKYNDDFVGFDPGVVFADQEFIAMIESIEILEVQ